MKRAGRSRWQYKIKLMKKILNRILYYSVITLAIIIFIAILGGLIYLDHVRFIY